MDCMLGTETASQWVQLCLWQLATVNWVKTKRFSNTSGDWSNSTACRTGHHLQTSSCLSAAIFTFISSYQLMKVLSTGIELPLAAEAASSLWITRLLQTSSSLKTCSENSWRYWHSHSHFDSSIVIFILEIHDLFLQDLILVSYLLPWISPLSD